MLTSNECENDKYMRSTKNAHDSSNPYRNFNTWIKVAVVSVIEIVHEYINKYYEHITYKTDILLFRIT